MKKWMEMMAYHKLELSLKLKAWMVIDRFFHRCVQEILLGCAETGLDPKKLAMSQQWRQENVPWDGASTSRESIS
ncbi:hypothetical protein HPP92_020071 [Vanilla planifolia]|uniref:Uncharacterized protein n=1 Tax=Vanilla planifolia TaxID=51239 RepID=A0A835ULD4_VANPL|nr:hypothetical protein HPP92_020071 [Vanilla planifolia]